MWYILVFFIAFVIGATKERVLNKNYTKEDMINASKYGYNFHKTTSFPEQEFEDSCIRNTMQWLTIFKKKINNGKVSIDFRF